MTSISVITAVYNGGKYLSEAIESVLCQTYRNFEYIIVNDGSTDDTLIIIKRYAEMDNRIVYLVQENKGPATARNVAISMSQGKWIAILDADDIALPERLERQLAYVETNPDIVLLGSDSIEINAKGDIVKEHRYPIRHTSLVRRIEKYKKFLPHSSCLYHTEIVKQIGGFNARFVPSEDMDLWLRLSEVGEIACLSKALVKLRKHPEGISHHNYGKTPQVMGTVARVCHLLRLMDKNDPSQQDEEVWCHFVEWIEVRMEQERVFEIKQKWAKLRERYISNHSHSRVSRMWKLVEGLAKSGDTFKILTRKIFGSNLSRKLAIEWVYYKKYCP